MLSGLDQLKTDVQNMEREIKSASRNQIKQATFDALLEQNEMIFEAMLEQEVNRQRQQMMQRFVNSLVVVKT